MRVILSADTVRHPLTGIGRYVVELGRELAQQPAISSLRFTVGARLLDQMPVVTAHEAARPNFVRQQLRRSALAVDLATSWSRFRRWQAFRSLGGHLFHGSNFYLPPFPGAKVVTIHDLSVFKWPECHPPERVRYLRREIARSLARADHLITDSEYTREEVASFFNWPTSRISAVPLASAAEFHPRATRDLAPVLAKHGLVPHRYVLFSGTIEPRKNLAVLLAAYQKLPVALRQRYPLVLCGHKGWRNEAVVAAIERGRREGWVQYLGYLPGHELPHLFAGARLFLFPSIYEGFGLPVLEAMASGIPVICSGATSLPEVAGDAAMLCDPQDTEGWRHAIQRGLEDEEWCREAVRAGKERSAQFSWRQTAEGTIRAYCAAEAAWASRRG